MPYYVNPDFWEYNKIINDVNTWSNTMYGNPNTLDFRGDDTNKIYIRNMGAYVRSPYLLSSGYNKPIIDNGGNGGGFNVIANVVNTVINGGDNVGVVKFNTISKDSLITAITQQQSQTLEFGKDGGYFYLNRDDRRLGLKFFSVDKSTVIEKLNEIMNNDEWVCVKSTDMFIDKGGERREKDNNYSVVCNWHYDSYNAFGSTYPLSGVCLYFPLACFNTQSFSSSMVFNCPFEDWYFAHQYPFAYDISTLNDEYFENIIEQERPMFIVFNNTRLFKKSVIIDYMNKWGVPFTFSENEAINTPIDELSDYKPFKNGQPENEKNVGGDGNGDNVSDKINLSKPTIQPISTFTQHYAVSYDNVNNLRSFLWDDDFLSNLRKLTTSPIENIVSCRMFPFNIYQHDTSGLIASGVNIGNIASNISGFKIKPTYNCLFDLGFIKINEYFGDFCDYSPYTTIDLYLPYYGLIPLDVDEVMNETIHLYYVVDITTGDCTSLLFSHNTMIDTRTFKIGVEVPMTSSDASSYYRNLINASVSGASQISMGGSNPFNSLSGTMTIANGFLNKRHIEKVGNYSPMNSLYMPQKPYLNIRRPYKVISSNYVNENGYPVDYYGKLNECLGYCRLANVELDLDIPTDMKDELTEILENGFYIEKTKEPYIIFKALRGMLQKVGSILKKSNIDTISSGVNTISIPDEIINLPEYGVGVNQIFNVVNLTDGKYYHNIKSLDLGSIDYRFWNYRFWFILDIPNYGLNDHADIICANYETNSYNGLNRHDGIASFENRIYIRDDSFNGDVNAFKNAMNGVILYYAASSPTETDISQYMINDLKFDGDIQYHTIDGYDGVFNNDYDIVYK